MDNINIRFCRLLLAQIKPDLKRAKLRMFKDGWVYNHGRDHWEFQGLTGGPASGFYWHGRANNAYEARYKGWAAYLEKLNRA